MTASFGTSMNIAAGFINDDQPGISVETKQQKELIGYYANGTGNGGQAIILRRSLTRFVRSVLGEWLKGDPVRRLGHHAADTAEFAVESIRRWWRPNWVGPGSPPSPRHLEVEQDRPPRLGHHDQDRAHHPSRLPPQLVSEGVRITDSEFAAALPVDRRGWRRDWNYTSAPGA